MLFDHYLCVFHWSPKFVSSNAKIQKTMVWVRFPGLNLLYYNESVLMGLAYVIGKPVRVDKNTLNVERGRFARVCVEIDLTQPVVGKYCLDDHWYRVEYERLHLICAKCGCYGHLTRNCTGDAGPAQLKLKEKENFGKENEQEVSAMAIIQQENEGYLGGKKRMSLAPKWVKLW